MQEARAYVCAHLCNLQSVSGRTASRERWVVAADMHVYLTHLSICEPSIRPWLPFVINAASAQVIDLQSMSASVIELGMQT